MRYLFLFLLILSVSQTANAASAAHFSSPQEKNAPQIGGVVGNNIVFMYWNHNASTITDTQVLDSMASQAKKQVCASKDTKMLIEELHKQVIFLYPNDKDGSFTIITIKDCKNIQ